MMNTDNKQNNENIKIKILMVTMGMDFGGAETHVLELCKELKAMGYDISVASGGGVYCQGLKEAGIPHYTMPLNRRKPGAMLKSYRLLSKLMKREGFDIVHAHARIPALLCHYLQKKYDFRYTTTAHLDFTVTPLLRRLTHWGEKTIAVSDDIKAYLIREYGTDEQNIRVTVNGIDMQTFAPERKCPGLIKELGLNPQNRRIVYVSRIDEDRSAPAFHLAELALRLKQRFGNIDIIIVGGGNDFDRLKTKADAVNAEAGFPLITLTGARSDIADFMAIADIFCGVSRSALEAMSAGCPVIVTGNQGYLGVFNEGSLDAAMSTNFCCRGCGEATAEKLYGDLCRELSKSEAELKAEGEYNREIIGKYYSARKMADDYDRLYHELPYDINFKHSNVIISGYYGFGNSGDDMILRSLISGLRRDNPCVRITALTREPAKASKEFDIRCVDRFSPLKVISAIKKSDALIFGGGTLLQDRTSTKSLNYYLWILNTACRLHKKVYVYANGIGPVDNIKNKEKTCRTLNKVNAISVRENDSREVLTDMGVPAEKIKVTADAVFQWQPDDYNDKAEKYDFLKSGEKYFGVSLRRLTKSEDGNGDMLLKEIADACRETAQKYNLIPVFIPMQYKADLEYCRTCAGLTGEGSIVSPYLESRDIPGLLSRMDFVIGMRLHALIFSVKAGVPVAGISYDPKVTAFLTECGIDAVLSPKDLTSGDLCRTVSRIMENREKEISRLETVCAEMIKKSEDEIRDITDFYRR